MKPQGRDFVRYAVPILGLFFVLAVAPVFYTTMMRDVFTLPKALPLALGAFLVWAGLTATGEVSFERSLTPGLVAMFAAMVLSACFSVDMPLSLLGPHQQQFYALLPLSICGLVYYAAANAERVPPSVFVILALIGGAFVSLIGLTQIGGHGFQAWSIQSGRIGSTFGTPIFLGAYLAMLAPLAWAHRREAPLILVLIVACLLGTRSRGSIIAAASGVLLIEYLRNERIGKLMGIFLPALAVVGALFMIRKTAHYSDGQRWEIWRIALVAWKSRPILGWGPDTFSLGFRQFMTQRFIDASSGNDKFIQSSAHNDLLQVLATLGLVGFAAYTFLSIRIVRLVKWALIAEPEAVGIAGALLALFVNAKFNPIPLVAIGIAAALLGSLDRSRYDDVLDVCRPKAALVAGSALLLTLVVVFMCKAEMHQRRAEDLSQMGREVESAEQFNIAAQINPFDLWYTQRQLDTFWLVIPKMPNVNRLDLAAFSHDISERIGRLHPYDPTAHELRALSYSFEGGMLGQNRDWETDHELRVAIGLAPGFSPYTDRRAELLHHK